MKVFISWSGSAEKQVAEALRIAVNTVCAGRAEAFVSSRDIQKGDRGISVIESRLSTTDYGVVILSRSNYEAPWINYEAGALASSLENPVATLLLDLEPSDFKSPLSTFQATRFQEADDVRRLLNEIALAADPSLPIHVIETLIDSTLPTLLESWVPSGEKVQERLRPLDEMLAEVVDIVRRLDTERAIDRRDILSSWVEQSLTPEDLARGYVSRRVHQGLESTIGAIVRNAAQQNVRVNRIKSTTGGSTRVILEAKHRATVSDRAAAESALRHRYPAVDWEFEWLTLLPEIDESSETYGQSNGE